ncbi:MAG TPA: hypothetical protein VFT69_04995 [Pseudolabrys sp.]|nr:hypothetical protein [Pseudolabrys sp.]
MHKIVLSVLFAAGVGLAGTAGASAAPAAGFSPVPAAAPLVEQVQYYRYRHWHRRHCWTERVCRRGLYGRRCWVRRVCR